MLDQDDAEHLMQLKHICEAEFTPIRLFGAIFASGRLFNEAVCKYVPDKYC